MCSAWCTSQMLILLSIQETPSQDQTLSSMSPQVVKDVDEYHGVSRDHQSAAIEAHLRNRCLPLSAYAAYTRHRPQIIMPRGLVSNGGRV